MLHYHLAIWQSAPGVSFILDGEHWDNDYPTVTTHESWFWHNESGQRVASTVDGKLLMNLADDGFARYWADSFVAQARAGDYDAIFADSASPALLQGEAQSPPEPRLSGTGARDTPIAEFGGLPYAREWERWIAALDARLAAEGLPLLPNTGAFITTWDDTRYDLTAGAFVEGFATPGWSETDWAASTNQLLRLSNAGKIVILQNYLGSSDDVGRRRYYLANYLLVRGARTYLDYFAAGPFEWYPEWALDLGAAAAAASSVDDLRAGGVYRRELERGWVYVNPTGASVTVTLPGALRRLEPQGGGTVDGAGDAPGSFTTTTVSSIAIPAGGAEIFLK